MVGAVSFLGLSVLLCLTGTAVSGLSKCRVASVRVVGSFSSPCDIQFGYTTALPEWIDQLQVVESFKNASDGQLDAFAKEACSCRMLRVHRHCPSDLFELIKGVAWRCFPGARDAVRKGIEDTIRAQEEQKSEDADGERRIHSLGDDERGEGDQNNTDNLQTEKEGEETEEDGPGTEKMSPAVLDEGNAAADGAKVITSVKEESSDDTSVDSVPVEEMGKDSLGTIPKNSFEDVTEVPTAPEGIDQGSTEESSDIISEDSTGTGIQDSTEGPVGGSTGEDENGNNTTDSGSEEVEEGYDDEDSAEDLELEGSAEEDLELEGRAPSS